MKTARDQLDILTAYQELGSLRAAAALCGTTHKTVRRVRRAPGRTPAAERPPRPKATDPHVELIAMRVKATDGRISAKRLMPRREGRGLHRLRLAPSGAPSTTVQTSNVHGESFCIVDA